MATEGKEIMADSFKRPGSADFEPLKQTELRGDFRPVQPEPRVGTPTDGQSRAEILIGEYDKTIAFATWLEGVLDDQLKDVVVEIDPEEQPEIWMAMQRIFSNPSPKLSYKSYVQVLTALEEVDSVEAAVSDPFAEEDQFIAEYTKQFVDSSTPLEEDTPEMAIDGEKAPTEPATINKTVWPQEK